MSQLVACRSPIGNTLKHEVSDKPVEQRRLIMLRDCADDTGFLQSFSSENDDVGRGKSKSDIKWRRTIIACRSLGHNRR